MMQSYFRWSLVCAFALFVAGRTDGEDKQPIKNSTLQFSEHLIADRFGYAYGLAVADIDNDGDLDPDYSSDLSINELCASY